MVEIRVPQKRSFINTPVGVARTDAGEARAAQQIANASRTLSNATYNTASQIMSAGSELQQNFEQRKFTEWASKVPIITESGEYATYEMPTYVSGKTRNQIDRILQNRYKVDSEVRLNEYMVQARAKHKNNEEAFTTDVSTFIEQTKEKISAAGGEAYAQDFSDISVQVLSRHINDIRKNLSDAADAVALSRKQTDLNQKASIVYNQFANNDPNAQESLDALLQEIDELPKSYKVGPEFLINTKAVILSDVARTQIITAGFSNLPDDQRQIVMAELQSGVLDQSLTILPVLQELMAPDGRLNTTANRERVFRDLSATDQKLRNANTFAQKQNSLLNTDFTKTGEREQEAIELILRERFGFTNLNELVTAAKTNTDFNDALQAVNVLPLSMVRTLNARRIDPGNEADLQSLFDLVDVTKDAIFDATGDKAKTHDKGLKPETMAFVLAVDGIRNAYENPTSQLEAIKRLTGDLQEVDALGRKFAEAGRIEAKDSYAKATAIGLANNALSREKDFNPEFVEKFAGVYARIAGVTDLDEADKIIRKIYNTYYTKYDNAYVVNGGYKEQAFMPTSYFDGLGLLKFDTALTNIVNAYNDETNQAVRLRLGKTVFVRPDPMNTREYGRWVLVNEQGTPLMRNANEFITIDTKAIEAETILQRRMRINEKEMERAIAIQKNRIRNIPTLQAGQMFLGGR
mgnify:CR=1 FL=1